MEESNGVRDHITSFQYNLSEPRKKYRFLALCCQNMLHVSSLFQGLTPPCITFTAWKVSRYEVFLVRMRENTDQKKLRIWTLFTQWLCSRFKIDQIVYTVRKKKVYCWIMFLEFLINPPISTLCMILEL